MPRRRKRPAIRKGRTGKNIEIFRKIEEQVRRSEQVRRYFTCKHTLASEQKP